jgi:hypothetical protein
LTLSGEDGCWNKPVQRTPLRSHRGNGDGRLAEEINATREAPVVTARGRQRDSREGQARPLRVTERFVVALKPGNSGGAKGPQFKDQRQKRCGESHWR